MSIGKGVFYHDGSAHDRNLTDLLWIGMASGNVVPEANRRPSVMLGGNPMVALGIIVVLLGGYLVYALAHPERF